MFFEGLIQGLTEFLPISSSGHLALLRAILGEGSVATTVMLHVATLLAVVIFFYRDIFEILRNLELKIILYLIIGTIPAVIVGMSIGKIVDLVFGSYRTTLLLLILNGLFILGTGFVSPHNRRINLERALIIGIYQAIAILPGISRSGVTIAIALYLGVNPQEAFRFSFLLSIPAIAGAGLLKAGHLKAFTTIWPGFIISFLSGLLALYLVRRTVITRTFYLFGIYCLLVGSIGLIFF
ncbi:hypothetical protein DRP53_04980 [candidate division WOR-3 bacterium]|uniref:Undecaprenyl-diphosphatase n=1 Tax=candidate division WOR-3 bacterium TaxID=2052148 RepID=A0A660SI01_UNCW3|nr:MAG: hypothetical protein DRP53_04980 [candidate division WOR-3 bacterium]